LLSTILVYVGGYLFLVFFAICLGESPLIMLLVNMAKMQNDILHPHLHGCFITVFGPWETCRKELHAWQSALVSRHSCTLLIV
jgi:hypothetical protein